MNPILQAMNPNKNNIKEQFQQFLNNNRGKSPEQIAKENNINIDMVYMLLSSLKQK